MSPRPISASVYSLRTERFCSMRSYISGWVNEVVALVVATPHAVAHEVDDDVLGEVLAELEGQPGHSGACFRSSPLTWKIGACTIRATSVQYIDDRDWSGEVVNPTWLLMTTWTVPPVR